MVQKPVVFNWMREEFAQGKKENIPAEALALLEAQGSSRKEAKKENKAREEKVSE